MLSPRTQEAQFNSTMHYQPSGPFIPSNNASQPGNPPITTQYQQNGSIQSNFQSANGYSVNHNNNYTISSNIPVSGSSSFSLPSVNQGYFDQNQFQQQGSLPPPQQAVSSSTQIVPQMQQAVSSSTQIVPQMQQAHQPQNSVFFGNNPPFFPPVPNSNNLVNNSTEYSYTYNLSYNTDSNQPGQPVQQPPLTSSQSVSNISTTLVPLPNIQSDNEDAPFPGVLEPQYRNMNNAPYHPRSATYPSDKVAKPKRSSSSSSSLLGMTPETARRNRCNICQKQFKRPSSLQTHFYSHTGEKPFVCNWKNCGRLFSVRSNMIRHRKLHERDAKVKKEGDVKESLEIPEDTNTKKTTITKKSDDSIKQKLSDNSKIKTATGGSLPNLLHPSNSPQSEFQLSW